MNRQLTNMADKLKIAFISSIDEQGYPNSNQEKGRT